MMYGLVDINHRGAAHRQRVHLEVRQACPEEHEQAEAVRCR